jgi:phosphoglycolate phosphatase
MRASLLTENVTLVLWDWNGTLLDDHEHCIRVMNPILREHGLLELDVVRYRAIFDFPVRRYYERLGFSLNDAHWEALATRFIADYERGVHACKLHDGAMSLLSLLARRGIRHAILSAAKKRSLEEQVALHGIRDYFEDVVGSDDHYAAGKKELGVQWLKHCSIAPERVVLVGDTVHDFEVARELGVRCVLVASGHHARDRLRRCGCTVVSTLAELVD